MAAFYVGAPCLQSILIAKSPALGRARSLSLSLVRTTALYRGLRSVRAMRSSRLRAFIQCPFIGPLYRIFGLFARPAPRPTYAWPCSRKALLIRKARRWHRCAVHELKSRLPPLLKSVKPAVHQPPAAMGAAMCRQRLPLARRRASGRETRRRVRAIVRRISHCRFSSPFERRWSEPAARDSSLAPARFYFTLNSMVTWRQFADIIKQ